MANMRMRQKLYIKEWKQIIFFKRGGNQMAYTGQELLMKKLKQIIYSNNYPLATPQFQLHRARVVDEELGSMIQTLFVEKGKDGIHKLEQVRNLKGRFEDVAEETYDMLDLFVSLMNLSSKIKKCIPTRIRFAEKAHVRSLPVFIEDAMILMKSIKEDYFSIIHNMNEMESSPTTDNLNLKPQSAAAAGVTSSSRNYYSPVWDEFIVGLDPHVELIRGKLAEDTKKLDVVSIVGMGGLVAQASYGPQILVIDDIWNTDAWDDLKVLFPNNDNGSRLLLTSRDTKVASHAKPQGFIHQLRCLTDEESWELLHKKVFHGNNFPDWLTGPGMQIARNCRGLPLAVVVMAGVLAKEPAIKDSWERISQSGGSSLIVKGHMETLALSLNHLPSRLRNCFLYLGGFPEDYRFRVTRLIWLWISEGFIQETKNQSVEETAKDYLMELVDRNLVVVQDRKFDCAIKTFSVHDVLRELSSEIATKERFSRKVIVWENHLYAPCKTSRLYIYPCTIFSCSLFDIYTRYIALKCSHSWRLLRVLDLKQCDLLNLPKQISLLVGLRYLAIRNSYGHFQSILCNIRSLQTLIIGETFQTLIFGGTLDDPLVLPNTISNLVNLRHLQCGPQAIKFTPLQTPFMNLQTVSNVLLGHETTSLVDYFPAVKKLSCSIYGERKYDLKSLIFLEILKISYISGFKMKSMISFPASLRRLTLEGCRLPWINISNIQSLPNLEVLKLLKDAFVGPRWDAREDPFEQLKFLKLEGLDILEWEASSINFPCLKQLVLSRCDSLDGIPLAMSYIPTLEHIQLEGCNESVIKSAYEIQEEQYADGNCDLKIIYGTLPFNLRIGRFFSEFTNLSHDFDNLFLN